MTAPTTPTGPVCGYCGNDGTGASLFLTIDARWRPAQRGWELQEREDSGGMQLDCLACDERTEVDGDTSFFPYMSVIPMKGEERQLSEREKAEAACLLLREARDLLKDAGASRAVDKVRLAMKSAEGAVRAASSRATREMMAQGDSE